MGISRLPTKTAGWLARIGPSLGWLLAVAALGSHGCTLNPQPTPPGEEADIPGSGSVSGGAPTAPVGTDGGTGIVGTPTQTQGEDPLDPGDADEPDEIGDAAGPDHEAPTVGAGDSFTGNGGPGAQPPSGAAGAAGAPGDTDTDPDNDDTHPVVR